MTDTKAGLASSTSIYNSFIVSADLYVIWQISSKSIEYGLMTSFYIGFVINLLKFLQVNCKSFLITVRECKLIIFLDIYYISSLLAHLDLIVSYFKLGKHNEHARWISSLSQ